MESKEYKIFFVKLMKFMILFLIIEFTLGVATQKIFFSQQSGKYSRIDYSIREDQSDILVMGSSHANRHVVPELMEDKTRMTCYNAGVQGQQLIFNLALQQMILKRHKPHTIILNLDRNWLYESQEAYDRLSDLYPYYWEYRDELHEILSLHSKFIKFKLLFHAYQTNSTIIHALKYYYIPQTDYQGYMPLFDKMGKPQETADMADDTIAVNVEIPHIDSNFVKAYKAFITNANNQGVHLIFVVSPYVYGDYGEPNNESLKTLFQIAIDNNVPVIDYTEDKNFVGNYELFSDPTHLNNDGARLFTRLLADTIQRKNLIDSIAFGSANVPGARNYKHHAKLRFY
jgi:hypothetical protein